MAAFALAALGLDSLVGIGAAWIDLQRGALIDRYVTDPDSVRVTELEASDLTNYGVGITQIAVYLVAALLFLRWLYRVRANAEILSLEPHRHNRAWMTFGWFVPVICFWFPKQIVDDIWNASDDRPPQYRSGLVWAWWVAWVIVVVGNTVVGRVLARSDDAATLAMAARLDVALVAVTVAAAGLAAAVVWKITGFQEARRTSLARVP